MRCRGEQKQVLEGAVEKIFILKRQAKHPHALPNLLFFFFLFQEGKSYIPASSIHD